MEMKNKEGKGQANCCKDGGGASCGNGKGLYTTPLPSNPANIQSVPSSQPKYIPKPKPVRKARRGGGVIFGGGGFSTCGASNCGCSGCGGGGCGGGCGGC